MTHKTPSGSCDFSVNSIKPYKPNPTQTLPENWKGIFSNLLCKTDYVIYSDSKTREKYHKKNINQ